MIPKPTPETINKIREDVPCLFYGTTHPGSRRIEQLNLLNIDDYLINWEILHPTLQRNIKIIVEGDWGGSNSAMRGIKLKSECPLAEHLLLLAGLGVEDMFDTAHRIVASNVRDRFGDRDRWRTDRSFIDPRAAKRRIDDFFKQWAPSKLMMDGMDAVKLLFNAPTSLCDVGERTDLVRDSYNEFFQGIDQKLHQWIKQRSIMSFYASHEISILNLAGSMFRPHVHAIIWLPTDKTRRFLTTAWRDGEVEELMEADNYWPRVRGFLHYIMRVVPFTNCYRTEWDENNREAMNLISRHGLRNYIEVQMHPGALIQCHRESKSSIPPANGRGRYSHPAFEEWKRKQRVRLARRNGLN